ncbi:MAG TPA: DUF4136 domain-containing protein [Chryseolinea sp.]|nr:DUF4136 domain-containing protein [Chryseolinea sp.]
MKILYYILVVFAVVACSSVTTSFDYDKSADFSKYKTYAFTEHTAKLPEINQLDRDRVLAAVDTEMAKRGYTKAESSPDILVDVFLKTEEEISATATNTGGYGRWGYGYGWGGGTTQVDYNKYTKGTLFISLVDRATEKIAWQGRGSKTLNENVKPERKEENIKSAIAAIFMKYPKAPSK